MVNTDWTVLYLRDCELSQIQRRLDTQPRVERSPRNTVRIFVATMIRTWGRSVVTRRSTQQLRSPSSAFKSHPVALPCATAK